ncbi:MAG: hypothetical protein KAU48_04190 [Candidatus Thorarchaeota archaeon]|nr:hypothetical protein [Candidatus Thorarchaeota archaeon]
MSPQSKQAMEFEGVLNNLKVIAVEQTKPSFRTYADVITIEIIFSGIAFVILIFGVFNQETLGEWGLPTTFGSVATVWFKSFKDGYDKVKKLSENAYNNMVFYNLMGIRISRLDSILDPQKKTEEIVEIKSQLNEWCKPMVGKHSDKCPY